MDQHNNKNSIDEIDQHIIEALQMDGRRPFTKIAADLGISEASVRQRVANLINTQVMQIVAITNPIKLGFSLASMIGIRVSGDRLLEAAQEISTFDEVIYLIICTGSFDLLAEVVCRDNDHLLSFLTQKLYKVCNKPKLSCTCASASKMTGPSFHKRRSPLLLHVCDMIHTLRSNASPRGVVMVPCRSGRPSEIYLVSS